MEKNNQRIIFVLPGDATATDVIFDILKRNNLEESNHEAYKKSTLGEDSRLIIIRDAALAIVEKKVPEQKLIELLQKHLETSKETAEKIVQDIKENLIPYAKRIDSAGDLETKDQKEVYREELLKKINAHRKTTTITEEEPLLPYPKKREITDVEKNAENMEKEGKNITTKEKSNFMERASENETPEAQETQPDTYREPIE